MENIEDAADKLSEHMESLAEIDSIIQESNTLPLGFNDDDDDELLAELAQFNEEIDEQTPPTQPGTIGITVADLELPSVPISQPANEAASVETALADEPIAL